MREANNGREVDIAAYVAAILAQDAEGMRRWLHPEAEVRWVHSRERFTAEEYIRANCAYPDSWQGHIERLERIGDLVIAVIRILSSDHQIRLRSVAFLKLKDGWVVDQEEYFCEDGNPPAWRQELGIGQLMEEE